MVFMIKLFTFSMINIIQMTYKIVCKEYGYT